MNNADIFDRTARRTRRDRIAQAPTEDRWLLARMAQELGDRWQDSGLTAERVLIIGHDCGILRHQLQASGAQVVTCDPSFALSRDANGVQCDEDQLPFAASAFDAIFSVGTLDSVNDVPGALILIRRALAPAGLFIGVFMGAGSLPTLRDCITSAETERFAARLHPQIDVRAAGDLLTRAGFSRPVADADRISARYSDLSRLVSDLRANGLSNVLNDRRPVSRGDWMRWQARFEAKRDAQGKVTEIFAPVHLTGYGSTVAASK